MERKKRCFPGIRTRRVAVEQARRSCSSRVDIRFRGGRHHRDGDRRGQVGQAVAQRAVKSWLEERRKSKERTASLAGLAAAALSTVRQRKRLEHLAGPAGCRRCEC
ncbi:NACHT N-terminal Helical domain 1-containing protein [Saccharopolyspora shandongensis]|uniref:NACHT N-terminal Helical domain 1-containing protein n=1 Tax=Saccharopolyspora shandongensis TaxID=418495 RepID=UPI003F4E126F